MVRIIPTGVHPRTNNMRGEPAQRKEPQQGKITHASETQPARDACIGHTTPHIIEHAAALTPQKLTEISNNKGQTILPIPVLTPQSIANALPPPHTTIPPRSNALRQINVGIPQKTTTISPAHPGRSEPAIPAIPPSITPNIATIAASSPPVTIFYLRKW
jgi:hypothetical protein